MYRRIIDKLEVKETQQEFQGEMGKNAEQFSELSESIGIQRTICDIEEWEQFVKKTASQDIGNKLIACNRAVKW